MSMSQLRSRRSSPSLAAAAPSTNAQVVDRHPLRSPSPGHGVAGPSNLDRPQAAPRRPSAVASEWKAISAGLAGLFGGGSTSAGSSSSYRWPADPASSSISKRASRRPINTVETTLDRLEDWFGLRQQQQQQQSFSSRTPSSASSHGTATATAHSADTEQVRVLIHPVAPTDTLPSLALHYGADIQALRKSNKLWPGDPVQIRKVIYIPVDSCKHRPPNAEIKVVPATRGAVDATNANTNTLVFVPKVEEEDLLTGTPTAEIPQPSFIADNLAGMRVSDPVSDFMPDTNKAYIDSAAPAFGTSLTRAGSINGVKQQQQSSYPASLAPSLRNLNQQQAQGKDKLATSSSIGGGSNTPSAAASTSAASSGFVPPRQPLHVAKVPADQLRFFANDAKAGSSTGRKPGPGDSDYQPGESGIDDLLASLGTQPQPQQLQNNGVQPELSRRQSSVSNVSRFNDDEEEEEWKPNTWHFGSSGSNNKPRLSTSDTNASNSYTGWNDAPPPPNAIVAKAYDGGKAYQKRQAQKSHRLLYDLVAGLPANTGAASKWARPIQFGDSLPSGDVAGTRSASSGNKGKGGLGKLLDDTIRGRISVEAALEGALEGVRGKTPLPQTRIGPPPSPARSAAVGATRQPLTQSNSTPAPAPPPPPQAGGQTTLIDPLSSSSPNNTMRPYNTTATGLEHRRKVDWTKGKDD
ncbi:hypothetical protein [Sporisorium scitamineum]|uniref:LysM domain-containing protein n=1 Tax=Sporisorium scitamineum TaxID=49012 RepID=A0A0F7RZN0_9BASI|nr:hypothetical protein [Sporisorium scitamineum]